MQKFILSYLLVYYDVPSYAEYFDNICWDFHVTEIEIIYYRLQLKH